MFLQTAACGFQAAANYAKAFGLKFNAKKAAATDRSGEHGMESPLGSVQHAGGNPQTRESGNLSASGNRTERSGGTGSQTRLHARPVHGLESRNRGPAGSMAVRRDEWTPEIFAELTAAETRRTQQREREAGEAFALWRAGKAPRPHAGYFTGNDPEIRAMWQAIHDDENRERWNANRQPVPHGCVANRLYFNGRDEHGGAFFRVRGKSSGQSAAIAAGDMDGLNWKRRKAPRFRLPMPSGLSSSCAWCGSPARIGNATDTLSALDISPLTGSTRNPATSAPAAICCAARKSNGLPRKSGVADLAPSDDAAEARPGRVA